MAVNGLRSFTTFYSVFRSAMPPPGAEKGRRSRPPGPEAEGQEATPHPDREERGHGRGGKGSDGDEADTKTEARVLPPFGRGGRREQPARSLEPFPSSGTPFVFNIHGVGGVLFLARLF